MRKKILRNPFISFYRKHKISPVHQNLSDFKMHQARRGKLYRSLGLAVIAFSKRRVLEVGPGGGYNALALLSWGAQVDFVEPNPKAQEEIPAVMSAHKIDRRAWKLFRCPIEDFDPPSGYEIVIAEGFIPGLYSRKKVVAKLRQLVVPGGVLVVTCADDIGCIFEVVKRLVAYLLIRQKGIKGFDDKVAILSKAFGPHLKNLKFVSRPLEDWVADSLLNPGIFGRFFTIAECIEEFGKEFEVLGSSPVMFTDYSWYKDVGFDRRKEYILQYHQKRHSLMQFGMKDGIRSAELNIKLAQKVYEIRMTAKRLEHSFTDRDLARIIEGFKGISKIIQAIDKSTAGAINEGVKLMTDRALTEEKIAKASGMVVFGRAQQFVSLTRKLL